jgi:hypothetical protein
LRADANIMNDKLTMQGDGDAALVDDADLRCAESTENWPDRRHRR